MKDLVLPRTGKVYSLDYIRESVHLVNPPSFIYKAPEGFVDLPNAYNLVKSNTYSVDMCDTPWVARVQQQSTGNKVTFIYVGDDYSAVEALLK